MLAFVSSANCHVRGLVLCMSYFKLCLFTLNVNIDARQNCGSRVCNAQNEETGQELNPAASAKEARQRLQKKADISNANTSLQDKYELLETI